MELSWLMKLRIAAVAAVGAALVYGVGWRLAGLSGQVGDMAYGGVAPLVVLAFMAGVIGYFVSWPYGREIGRWMRKALESSLEGALVVCLVPARTDTQWWHKYAMRGEIRYLRGRLRFGNAAQSAPGPRAIVICRPPIPPHVLRPSALSDRSYPCRHLPST